MDGSHDPTDTVHPEVRAYINSLVSALGGVSADSDGQYQLGDDALEVLRDIKRWIRFYDEKTNRMDVARCLYDSNIVEGDLLPILAQWPENADDNKAKARLALTCLEVLVPLTWSLDRDQQSMTVNHHRHMPVLQLAQVQYKRSIINFDGCRILHTAVRTALPSLAMPIGDRTARDQGIIKLALFFLRNLAMISPPPDVKYDGDETQISRSATIDAFSYQDIFMLLLTIASTMGEEFRTEDTVVMEILYHLVKRVDPEQLFMSEEQVNKANASKLSSLMLKESNMLKAYNRNGPTRHSRFGSMLWVRREGGKMSTISGQDSLADPAARNERLDSNKTFKPPRRARRRTNAERDLGPPVRLNARAKTQLRSFVEELLDSGFNPLFGHIRKSIDREALHVMNYHKRQFFYLVAWFLQAERVRRHDKQSESRRGEAEVTSFNLVAAVLNQEMFITLTRSLHESYDFKDWQELTAVMRCFTEILLTVQEMTSCGNDEDEEIADNILNRLFYEETTHDAIANIIRTYKDQEFDYLDASTELAYHFLRILEAYSKQNADLQVRSRRRGRRKKQAGKQDNGNLQATEGHEESAEEEEAAVERSSKERKFDFHRFSSKFTPQGVVDTFTAFTRYYRDLSEAQLKRAHRYFYRLAFKQEMSVMLFRVDVIKLFHDMVRGPVSLEKTSPMFRDWEELTKQILRRCFKKLDDRPELLVEMLFSKLPGTAFFLEYGYEKQTAAAKKQARPGLELEFKSVTERDQQIAIVIGALLDRNEADHIAWLKGVLAEAQDQRQSWQDADEARMPDLGHEPSEAREPKRPPIFHVRPDGPSRQTAIFKNSHLRLLMTCCHLQRLGPVSEETPESSWIIPDEVSAQHLKDSLHFISQAEFDPPTFEDGGSAEMQLKRKIDRSQKDTPTADSDDPEMDDEFLFPKGGPTTRKAIDEEGRPKKLRRKRRRTDEDVEAQDEVLDERAQKRRERELEKARRIKSAVYVREGDDDFDAEENEVFFARERAIAARAKEAAASAATHPVPTASKRVSDILSTQSGSGSQNSDADSDNTDADTTSRTESTVSPRKRVRESENGELEVEMVEVDRKNGAVDADADMITPPSQEPPALSSVDEVEDAPTKITTRSRRRIKHVVESSEEEEDNEA